jgi:hypothetical protein
MKQNQTCNLVLIFLCIGSAVIFAGCTGARPDPETGITAWITAVNNHDYDRVYDLGPREIQQQVSRSAFITAQRDNPLLAPGNLIKDYTIEKKTISENNAAITVQLILHTPAGANQSARDIALYIKFVETFENGEWKVWTAEP